MKQAASEPADGKELWGAVQDERLSKGEGSRSKDAILGKEVGWLPYGYLPLGAGRGPSGRSPH